MKMTFSSFESIRAALSDLPDFDHDAHAGATARNGVLTKPPGALGRLEELAIWYASWTGQAQPTLSAPQIAIFAGNHGIAEQGVSAFPPAVTEQMVFNFEAGGAAINQLAKLAGARFSVHSLDLQIPTQDFTQDPALGEQAFLDAFHIGYSVLAEDTDLLVVGEMGIGNTTSAAALYALIFGGTPEDWVGRGTGVDDEGLSRKAQAVQNAMNLHSSASGIEALAAVGGREMAAMAGALFAARQNRVPVLLDGFVATASLAALWAENPDITAHCVAAHKSDESAHSAALENLGLHPLLDLGLRLGEGSGAALAIQILKGAIACHSGMATFADAGVSEGK